MKKKLLMIEDDRYYNDDVSFFLDDAGYDCLVAQGEDYLTLALTDLDQYDAVLLDIMLPNAFLNPSVIMDDSKCENGEKIFKFIRDSHPELPIVIVSAKDKDKLNVRFEDDHFASYVPKPIIDGARVILDELKTLMGE